MDGRASAPAAGTVLNALANGTGSAFAIDLETTATVDLEAGADAVTGEIDGAPEADTALIERCVELVIEECADRDRAWGGHVRTESEVPLAAGLKSSSAAANATVLAALDALGTEVGPAGDIDRLAACRLGVRAAREAGVTVTGAFDDASASMLGGVTVTNNSDDELLAHEPVDWDVLVWTPPVQAFSADADVASCRRIAPVADVVGELAMQGRYGAAMSINGFAFCGALDFPTAPLLEALPAVDGVSLSGTGPSYVAVGDRHALADLRSEWDTRDGTTWLTTTRTDGTRKE